MMLVTGGAGFIGSNLVEKLINEGMEARVLDNFSTGKKENLEEVSRNTGKRIDLVKGDIRDADDVKRALKDISVVFHHAAQIDVRTSMENPINDMDINIRGSINLIQHALDAGVEKFVYASSGGAMYGEPEKIPADENTPVRPISPYGVSKASVELYLFNFYKTYGFDYTALRYGNVYGRRQDPMGEAGVIAIFTNKVKQGFPVVIFGDGTQTRDFIDVRDVVEANVLAMKTKTAHREFNIGTGTETSVNELVDSMEKITGKKIKRIYEKKRKGEVMRIALDVKRAASGLKFTPKIRVYEGIKSVLSEGR